MMKVITEHLWRGRNSGANAVMGAQMITWGLRITTYVTNCAVLVAYAYLYSWLLNTKIKRLAQMRTFWLSLLAWTALILFHFASVFSMAEAKNPMGFGWNYMNFQVAVVIFALFGRPPRGVAYSLLVIITIWYAWMPRVPHALLIEIGTVVTIWLLFRYSHVILAHANLFFPFGFLFIAPFYLTNYISLAGIDVGWSWLLFNYILILLIIWTVYHQVLKTRQRQAELLQEATIDELTQLRNFRLFDSDLAAHFRRLQEQGENFALYTFDIDHFKQINDHYGHLLGNAVLSAVATKLLRLAAAINPAAACYRTGGEEFTFIIADAHTDFSTAVTTARMIQDELAKLSFTTPDGTTFHISISLGQDNVHPDDRNYLEVYNRADKYLYNSKDNGRNAITVQGVLLT